jgi:hypothetical protein
VNSWIRHRGHHLVVEDQVGCEPEFDSAELVVVVGPLAQVPAAGAGVASGVLKLQGPRPLVGRRYRLDGFTGGPKPVPEGVVRRPW